MTEEKQNKEEEKFEKNKESKKDKRDNKKIGGKKKEEKLAGKKTEAVVNGKDLPISTKHAIAICNLIRGKKVEDAMFLLQEVIKMKKAVPMKGELPHRKGKGMERGRYPIKASQQFIKLLKQLSANAVVNEIDLEKVRVECKANRASRPYRRFGDKRFKRSHVFLRLKEWSKIKRHKIEQKKKIKELG